MARIVALLAVLASGCATSDRVTLSAGPSQQAIVRDGVPALVSHKQNTIMLRPVAHLMRSGARPTRRRAAEPPSRSYHLLCFRHQG